MQQLDIFHCNAYSYVTHDCVIGDYVTFGPSLRRNGNILIEEHAHVDIVASIIQGKQEKPLTIRWGDKAGMDAIFTKNVPPGMTVFGNSASSIIKEALKK